MHIVKLPSVDLEMTESPAAWVERVYVWNQSCIQSPPPLMQEQVNLLKSKSGGHLVDGWGVVKESTTLYNLRLEKYPLSGKLVLPYPSTLEFR